MPFPKKISIPNVLAAFALIAIPRMLHPGGPIQGPALVAGLCLYAMGPVDGITACFLASLLCCMYADDYAALPGWLIGGLAMNAEAGLSGAVALEAWRCMKRPEGKILIAMANVLAAAVSAAIGILLIKSSADALFGGVPFADAVRADLDTAAVAAACYSAVFPLAAVIDGSARRRNGAPPPAEQDDPGHGGRAGRR